MRMRTRERKDFVILSLDPTEELVARKLKSTRSWDIVFGRPFFFRHTSDTVSTTLGDGGGKLSGENSAGRRDAGARGRREIQHTGGPTLKATDILALLLY